MTSVSRIYLDFNASTPVAPEVIEAMKEVLNSPFGNPSSESSASMIGLHETSSDELAPAFRKSRSTGLTSGTVEA